MKKPRARATELREHLFYFSFLFKERNKQKLVHSDWDGAALGMHTLDLWWAAKCRLDSDWWCFARPILSVHISLHHPLTFIVSFFCLCRSLSVCRVNTQRDLTVFLSNWCSCCGWEYKKKEIVEKLIQILGINENFHWVIAGGLWVDCCCWFVCGFLVNCAGRVWCLVQFCGAVLQWYRDNAVFIIWLFAEHAHTNTSCFVYGCIRCEIFSLIINCRHVETNCRIKVHLWWVGFCVVWNFDVDHEFWFAIVKDRRRERVVVVNRMSIYSVVMYVFYDDWW